MLHNNLRRLYVAKRRDYSGVLVSPVGRRRLTIMRPGHLSPGGKRSLRGREAKGVTERQAAWPRYSPFMDKAPEVLAVSIRPAIPEDENGIVPILLESAVYHADLDPERYFIPNVEEISARYRRGPQHPRETACQSATFVAECNGAVVGFIDARLERSGDPMHREIIYCHVAEIAVGIAYRHQGIGRQLLRAAEAWGRSQGAQFASLEYHAANTRASSFYQHSMGYSVAAITAIKRL